jgi:hypothetical protein
MAMYFKRNAESKSSPVIFQRFFGSSACRSGWLCAGLAWSGINVAGTQQIVEESRSSFGENQVVLGIPIGNGPGFELPDVFTQGAVLHAAGEQHFNLVLAFADFVDVLVGQFCLVTRTWRGSTCIR